MNDAAAATITNYQPVSLPGDAAAFARDVVAACAPKSAARAKALLFATGRLGRFCSSVGLKLTPEICLHPSVVERFVATGCQKMSKATRRTLRTNLRFVARAVLLDELPAPARLSRERAKAPYSEAEIASYLALSDAQASLARRHRLGALVCLGAGAGLLGADLRLVTGNDVSVCPGGVVVKVRGGRRQRLVPVLARYHDRLLDACDFAADGYLIGGTNPRRENVTDRLVSAAARSAEIPRIDTGRLRSTWLVATAEAIGLKAFMDAAGITCSQRLGDLVAWLAPLSKEEVVTLLGGRC